ncbi:MAG: PAS domain S-box protein [Prochloraceae cyanobacterium]
MTEAPIRPIGSSKQIASSEKDSLEKLQQDIDFLRRELETCKSKQYRLLEVIPQIAWVANTEGEIVYFNQKWQEYTGLEASNPTNKQFFSAIAREQRERICQEFKQAIAASKPYETNISLRQVDGNYNNFSLQIQPLFDRDLNIDIWIGMCVEVETENQLERKKQFMRAMLDNLSDGIVACNSQGELTLLNRSTEKFHGLPAKAISPERWSEYYSLHLADGKTLMEKTEVPLYRALQGESVKGVEMTIVPKSGKIRHIIANADPIYSSSGEKLGAVAAMRDISESVIAEKKLQLKETKFKALFDRSCYWAIVLTPDGKIKEINRTILNFMGVKKDSNPIGADFLGLEWWRGAEKEQLKQAIESATGGKTGHCELEAIGAEKKRAIVAFAITPILDRSGKVREIIAEAKDITAKKQAEKALEKSQERWQMILKGSADGIFDWDINSGKAFMSESLKNMLGYEDKDIENEFSAWGKLLHPEDLPKVQQAIADHLEKRTPKYKAEYRMMCKDGSYKWILAWGKAKWDEQTGKPIRMVGTHTDIDDRKKAEVLLQQREELYRLLADNSTDIISIRNKEGTIDYISPAVFNMLGYRPEELLGTSIYQLFHPEDAKALEKTYALINKLPEKIVHTQRLRHREGYYLWVEIIDRPIRSRDGKISNKFISVCRDISDRKLAEAQVIEINQELEERVKRRTAQLEATNRLKDDSIAREKRARSEIQVYADIVKNIQIGLCIWQLKDFSKIESFRLVATNPAASQLLSLPIQEKIGQKWSEIFPNDIVEFKPYFQAFAEVVKTQKIHEFEEFYYQKEGYSQIVLALKAFPLPGDCVGVSFEDITQRKQTEKALISTNRQYSNVVNSVREVIFQTDITGRWTFLNPAWEKITKYTVEESINNNFEKYICSGRSKKYIKALFVDLIQEKKKYFEYEFRCQTKTGTMRWLEIKFQLDRDENGNILGTVGTIDDITSRKRAEVTLGKRAKELSKLNSHLLILTAELEKRNQELDSFAHVISHDLKEPLRAVGRLSQWLQEDLEDKLEDSTRHQMNLLQQRVERMQAFIDGLLQYSRLGRTQSEPELINLNEFLADIIDSLSPPPEFKIQLSEVMPNLYTESLPLQQVFFNLISNAIKHHHLSNGEVKISHRDLGESYEFSVSDNGPGIAPKDREKIFAIFKTLAPKKKDTTNTGIGLSIVKKSIEDRGGTIKVESELGQGTTFRFTWPKFNMPVE